MRTFTAFPTIHFPNALEVFNFEDVSYGNDSCARAELELDDGRLLRAWIDFDDPTCRETTGAKYALVVFDAPEDDEHDTLVWAGDDVDHLEAAIWLVLADVLPGALDYPDDIDRRPDRDAKPDVMSRPRASTVAAIINHLLEFAVEDHDMRNDLREKSIVGEDIGNWWSELVEDKNGVATLDVGTTVGAEDGLTGPVFRVTVERRS